MSLSPPTFPFGRTRAKDVPTGQYPIQPWYRSSTRPSNIIGSFSYRWLRLSDAKYPSASAGPGRSPGEEGYIGYGIFGEDASAGEDLLADDRRCQDLKI
jgi:hypothetical protein